MAKKKETAIVKAEKYAITKFEEGDLRDIITENLGGGAISAQDLVRVTVPAGGSTTFRVPTLEGEDEKKEVYGIIIHIKNQRVYWAEPFSGGGSPPDCISEDNLTGVGEPGGNCLTCPFAQFGTAVRQDGNKGKGQACSQQRLLFVLQPDSLLPIAVKAPPSSLKATQSYLVQLTTDGVPKNAVITKITLARDKSSDGIEFSKLELQKAGEVPADTLKFIKGYAKEIRPHLDAAASRIAAESESTEEV